MGHIVPVAWTHGVARRSACEASNYPMRLSPPHNDALAAPKRDSASDVFSAYPSPSVFGRMPGKKSSVAGHSVPNHAGSQLSQSATVVLDASHSPRSARSLVSSRGQWCAKCQNNAHWTFECFQQSERACLQEQLSYAIAACETRQAALRQRQEDVAAQRELHAVEMQIAISERNNLAAHIEELERKLMGALAEERRLIDTVDKTRLELNDTRKALRACTDQCENLQQSLAAAHEDKEMALKNASDAAAQRALINAQQVESQIAQTKAEADAETKRCLREAAKKFAQDLVESQTQLSESARRIDDLQASLVERKRELKGLEKQLGDEKANSEAKVAQAVADTEARVKMTMKGLKKELSDANAVAAEYKRRCEELQMSLLQAQHDASAREASAAAAAAQHEAVVRNFEDELEAQQALHSAEMQLADAEQARLAMQVYELEFANTHGGRA
jgi:hypothetical protein